jgi:outer membrane protein TolC
VAEPASRRAATLLLAALLPGATLAAQAPELRLTLDQALRLAEERNPELLAARGRAEAQALRGESQRRSAWPRLSAQLAWSRSDTPAAVFANKLNAGQFTQGDFALPSLLAPAPLNHLGSMLMLEVPLDFTGRIRDRADAQAAGARAASAAAREALLDTRLRVSEAYRRGYLLERAREVTSLALRAAQAREDELSERVLQGAALEADRLRARARRRQRQAELAERGSDSEGALAALARALASGPSERPLPSEPAAPPPPLEGDEAEWQARAQARPVLEAAREAARAAELQGRAETRSRWPELGAFAQLRDDRTGSGRSGQSGSVGFALRVDVLDGMRGKRQAAAAAEQRAAEESLKAAGDQVRFEVKAAFHRARAARLRVEAAAGGAEEGREALRVVRERRLSGLATLTDELETEAAALAAELLELQALAEAALADAALRRAAGEI